MTKNRSTDIHGDLKRAVKLHRAGQIDAAKALYVRILAADPDHAEALHLLGVTAYQLGACDTAVKLISKAVQRDAACAAYHNNLGNALLMAGHTTQAIESYHRALALEPDYAEVRFDLGNAYFRAGQTNDAIDSYQKAIALMPLMAEAHNNLGIALQAAGDTAGAADAFEAALTIRPDYLDALKNLGRTLMKLKLFDEAATRYEQALKIDPNDPELHAEMGGVLHETGHLSPALSSYRKAVAIRPEFGEVFNAMGLLYREMSRPKEAAECFSRCIALKPDDPVAYNNMGIILKSQERFDEAIPYYQKALQLKPDFAEACYNLGNAYGRKGELRKAVGCYRRAIQLKPDYISACCMLVRQLQHGCYWAEAATAASQLRALTDRDVEKGSYVGVTPFLAFSISDDPRYNYKVSKVWSDEISRKIKPLPTVRTHIQREAGKITVGYLSGDFKNHATAHLMRGLFACHDRQRFQIYGYSYGTDDGSDYRRQIASQCDRFVDLRQLNDEKSSKVIHEDGVDILLDLKGHTEGNRLEICAYRPAPLQVAYLGFPGTSGADFIDYMITDRIVSPSDHMPFFTEKLVYLPPSYQVNDREQEIDDRPVSRAEFGLPPKGTVFCSFNESYKIEPVIFDMWMEILRQVPDSVLWLLDRSAETVRNLQKEAKGRGVKPERLIFARKLPKPVHLARIRLADIGLDTRIVNGHTTTSDALWAGVPVITLVGTHFASRVSASLLSAVGLETIIARSSEAYIRRAVDLASNPQALRQMRIQLEKNRLTAPLFDTRRFTRNMEAAYIGMWERYCSGKAPESFAVNA